MSIKGLKSGAGFSIIEIVITIFISMTILLVTYDIFLISQKSFTIGDARLELIQNSRVVLDRLTRELRQTSEIVTALPLTKSVIGFPPPNEIQFQDGHGLTDIQYIRYYLIDNSLYRQRIAYSFSEEPDTYVAWNAENEYGQPPNAAILDNKIIAEYITDLIFFGTSNISIEIWLEKKGVEEHFYTGVWGRNTKK